MVEVPGIDSRVRADFTESFYTVSPSFILIASTTMDKGNGDATLDFRPTVRVNWSSYPHIDCAVTLLGELHVTTSR